MDLLPRRPLVGRGPDAAVAAAEVEAGLVVVVGAQGVAHDGGVVAVGQDPLAQRLPGRAGVGGAVDPRLPVDGPAGLGAGDREVVRRVRAVRVGHHGEAELGRQPRGDVLPGRAAVVGAVDAAVVLQVEPLGVGGVAGDLVHALAELRVVALAGEELRLHPGVRRLPRRAAVLGDVHPARGQRREHARGVGGVRAGSCGRPARRSPRSTPGGAGGPRGRGRARTSRPGPPSGRPRPARCPPRRRRRRRRPRCRAAAATPGPASRRCPRGSGRRRWASRPTSRRGRRSATPAGRASSTRRRRAGAACSPRVSTMTE